MSPPEQEDSFETAMDDMMGYNSLGNLGPSLVAALDEVGDDVPFRAKTEFYHSTWARTFHSRPELYIQPQSIAEVEKAINLAWLCRRRVTTVGCGHSPSELTCTSSWLLNLDNFNKVLNVDREKNVVVMQSGIRLYALSEELDRVGLAMPNLGSINEQSIAGAISTGTHGSTLQHGLLSDGVLALKITLANGETVSCSRTQHSELFDAALLSLGALGIITEITFQAVPAFTLAWKQVVDSDAVMLKSWSSTLWTQAEFVRVWWFPYTRRAVVWSAAKTDDPISHPPKSHLGSLGYHVYHNLLYLGHYVPEILPFVEWFIFGLQFGFANGTTTSAVQPSRKALLMDCLYSQYVNEWAIPLSKGPEALHRMSSWLNHLQPSDPEYVPHNIPFSAEGIYVHAPIEVRVTDTSSLGPRPYLDHTEMDGPTLYLNATLYRPYDLDPPCRARYYEAFEFLMRELGGRPHWAKNFGAQPDYLDSVYGERMIKWKKIRDAADPSGIFVGDWHRQNILGPNSAILPMEELKLGSEAKKSGGVLVSGAVDRYRPELVMGKRKPWGTPSGMESHSDDGFDVLRASEYGEKNER